MRAVNPAYRHWFSDWRIAAIYWLIAVLLSACQAGIVPIGPAATQRTSSQDTASPSITPEIEATVLQTPTQTHQSEAIRTLDPTETAAAPESQANQAEPAAAEPSPTKSLFGEHNLAAEAWKDWPVVPRVPKHVADIYQHGLTLGNDPKVFSILGDCQSLPETFLGIYDTDPDLVESLPKALQETVANFKGSFDRQSPTIKGGTTAGAILWAEWHENTFSCQASETPLSCELRLSRPSIMIINLGTHYETRNITYLRKILDELIDQGIVPILSTKADNREMDERLNLEMTELAIEYDVPLWNFYAAVTDLPNNGVGIKEGEEHLGEIYLSEAGLARHRLTALQAIAAVWQAVRQP